MCKTKRVFTIESKNLKKSYMKQTTKAQKYRKIKFEVIYVVKGYGFGSFSISIFEAITLQIERSSSKVFALFSHLCRVLLHFL